MSDQTYTCKSIYTKAKKLCLFSSTLHIGSAFAPIPELGTPSSDSATAFKMLLTLGNKTSH
jgi:hypothetical protein